MDDEDERLMAEYGITTETKVIFHYGQHRYDQLSDAVNYAKAHPPSHDDPGQTSPETQADSID